MPIPLVTVEELHSKMNRGEDILILDVRNTDDYNDWKIEGKTLQHINIPYFDFLEDDVAEQHAEALPKDREIVVVCAKGGSSEFIVEMLHEKGLKVFSLEGGMLAWSGFYHPTTVYLDEQMKLIQVNRLSKGCLAYMVISEGTAMVVDANRNVDVYMEIAKKNDATIKHVVDTHLHADHISGGPCLAEQTGATYYISSGEAKGSQLQFEPLENYQSILVGEVKVEVLAIPTPGHTPGSTSFFVNNKFLISGDTIFVGGLGRPDLGGKAKEWANDLFDTVFVKLANISDDVMVLPAHYADIHEMNDAGIVGATLGEIRESNDIMKSADREAFTQQVAAAVSTEKPPNFEEIIAINRRELIVEADQAIELEIGPNRCAVHHQN